MVLVSAYLNQYTYARFDILLVLSPQGELIYDYRKRSSELHRRLVNPK